MVSINPAKPTPLEDEVHSHVRGGSRVFGSFATHDPVAQVAARKFLRCISAVLRFKPADLTGASPGGSEPWSTDGPCRASATHGPGRRGAEWPLRTDDEFPCHDEHLGRFGGSPRVRWRARFTDHRRSTEGRPADLAKTRKLRPDVGCLGPSQRWNGGSLSIPSHSRNFSYRTKRHCGCPRAGPWTTAIASHAPSCTDGNYVSISTSHPEEDSVTPH